MHSTVRAVGVLMLPLVTTTLMGCASHRLAPASAPAARTDTAAPRSVVATTVESTNPKLSAALAAAAFARSPEAHRHVAAVYADLGILDYAHDHYERALALDSGDVLSHDGLAKLWRDWGFPEFALGAAYRTIAAAPTWAPGHNTLGTILQVLGFRELATIAYTRALELDPSAGYAQNNLGYLALVSGDAPTAVRWSEAAVEAAPRTDGVRNNLALAYAAIERHDLAWSELLAAGDRATALYNLGVLHTAAARYSPAMEAFEAAGRARPGWTMPHVRLEQLKARWRGEER